MPAVRAEVFGQDNLTQAVRDAADLADDPAYQELQGAMAELEAGHQRRQTTHRGMAGKMLGEARGSGYTAGVPYLEKCLENRLFTEAIPPMCQRLAS